MKELQFSATWSYFNLLELVVGFPFLHLGYVFMRGCFSTDDLVAKFSLSSK